MAGRIEKETVQLDVIVNGKRASRSYADLTKEARSLNAQLRNMTPGTDAFIRKSKELQKVKGRLREIRQEMGGNMSRMEKLQSLAGKVGVALGAAFVVTKIIEFGKELFNLAVEMEEVDRKAKVVFGTSMPMITKAAEENRKAMGLTVTEYKAAATSMADLLKPIGFTTKQSAEMSAEMVNLSGALSEWTGGQMDAAEVSEILAKALLGENEQLKQLGIAIRKDTDEFRDLVKVKMEDEGATKLQAEALAEMELILKKTTDAQNAFNDQADSLLRKKKTWTTFWKDIKEGTADYFSSFGDRVANMTGAWDLAMNNLKKSSNEILGTDFAVEPIENFTNVIIATQPHTQQLANTVEEYGINSGKGVVASRQLFAALKQLYGEDAKAIFNTFLKQQQDGLVKMIKQERAQQEFAEEQAKLAADKKAEALLEKQMKLQEKIDALDDKFKLSQLSKDEAELEQIRQKFAKLLEEEDLSRQQKAQLVEMRETELEAKKEEFRQRDIAKELETQEALFMARQSDNEAEITQALMKWDELILQAEQYGLDVTELERARNAEILAIQQDQAQKEADLQKKKNEQWLAEQQKRIAAEAQLANDVVQIQRDLIHLLADEESQYAEFQKLAALAQIAIDTAASISSLTAASQANPTNAVTFGGAGIAQYAAGIVQILGNMARAKQILSTSKAPSFFFGGDTGTGDIGFKDNQGRNYRGAVHENEYVVPEFVRSDPAAFSALSALEAMRTNKLRGYADGGATTGGDPGTEPTTGGSGVSEQMAEQLLGALDTLNGHLSRGILAKVMYGDLTESVDQVDRILKDTNIEA